MKKALAWLMALLFVCAACVTAPRTVSAAASCPHEHTTDTVFKKATCTESGYGTRTCTRCGYSWRVTYPALGHNWGKDKVLYEATCTTKGKAEHTCKRCGIKQSHMLDALGHEWSEWYVYKYPAYNSDMIVRRVCMRGDVYEEKTYPMQVKIEAIDTLSSVETMKKGDIIMQSYKVTNLSELPLHLNGYASLDASFTEEKGVHIPYWNEELFDLQPGKSAKFGLKHRVNENDIANMKFERFVKISGDVYSPKELKGSDKYTGDIVSNYAHVTYDVLNKKRHVTIELTGMSAPDIIEVGSVITGTYKVTNNSDLPIMVNSYSVQDGDGGFMMQDKSTGAWPNALKRLEPGQSGSFRIGHIVNNNDYSNVCQLIRNTSAWYKVYYPAASGEKLEGSFCTDSAKLVCEIGDPPTEFEEEDEEVLMVLTKKIFDSALPPCGYYSSGEVVAYRVTLRNESDCYIENFTVTEHINDPSGTTIDLGTYTAPPHVNASLTWGVTITPEMAAMGSVEDYVTVTVGGKTFTSNTVVTPTGFGKPDVTVEKVVTNMPESGVFTGGETVRYEVTVTNNSNYTLKDCVLTDLLDCDGKTQYTFGSLKAGKTYTAKFEYTVKEDDYSLVHNVAQFDATTPDGTPVQVFGCVTVLTDIVPIVSVEVDKKVTSTPDNGSFYTEGETVTYELSITNQDPNNKNIEQVKLADDHDGNEVGVASAGSLWAGKTLTGTFEYEVTADDVEHGSVDNIACGYFTPDNITDFLYLSDTVTVGTGDPGTVGLVKSIVKGPKNGSYYTPGEQLTFRFTVYNNSVFDIASAKITDPLPGTPMFTDVGPVKAGEHVSVDIPCDLGELAVNSTLYNAGILNYSYGNGQGGSVYSNTVYFDYYEENSKPGVKITKKEISTPAGDFYEEDEDVIYEITVTNTGDTALTGGDIYDVLAPGSGRIDSFGTLEPGKSYTTKWTYNGGSGGSGFVVNQAIVIAHTRERDVFAPSNTVTTNYGHIEKFEDEVTGDPGDACELTLIACADGELSYELINCDEHAAIDTKVRADVAAATTADELAAAWENGVTLWTDAAVALYEEAIAATFGPESRSALMLDRQLFLDQVAAKRALLEAQYAAEPAVVAELVCNLCREKCTELCMLYHGDRETAPDKVSDAPGAALYADCRMDLLEEKDGYLRYALNFCADHLDVAESVNAAIRATVDGGFGDTTEQWANLRGIWQVLLDSATLERYNNADAALKELLLADDSAFDAYLNNYELLLARFVPNDECFINELLTRALMLRTLQLCGDTEERVYVCKADLSSALTAGPLFAAGTLKAIEVDAPNEGPHIVEAPEMPPALDGPGMVKESKVSAGLIIALIAVGTLLAGAVVAIVIILIKKKKR